MQCKDVLYIAFREARILKRPQAVDSSLELQDGMIYGNQQLDYWSARGCYAWTTTFNVFTLTAGHQPHLIGPNLVSPDFALTPRPVNIQSASLMLSGNPQTDQPINIRDKDWWAAQRVKSMTSSVPTDLYYEPHVASASRPSSPSGSSSRSPMPSSRRRPTSPPSRSRSQRNWWISGARKCL